MLLHLWPPPRHQFSQDVIDDVPVGRAARHEDVYVDDFVDRTGFGQEGWDDFIGTALVQLGILKIGPTVDRLCAKGIAHSRYIRRHRAVAQRDQKPGVGAYLLDFRQMGMG